MWKPLAGSPRRPIWLLASQENDPFGPRGRHVEREVQLDTKAAIGASAANGRRVRDLIFGLQVFSAPPTNGR